MFATLCRPGPPMSVSGGLGRVWPVFFARTGLGEDTFAKIEEASKLNLTTITTPTKQGIRPKNGTGHTWNRGEWCVAHHLIAHSVALMRSGNDSLRYPSRQLENQPAISKQKAA